MYAKYVYVFIFAMTSFNMTFLPLTHGTLFKILQLSYTTQTYSWSKFEYTIDPERRIHQLGIVSVLS